MESIKKRQSMKKIIRNIGMLAVAAAALGACKQSERLMFDEPASIYFYSSQWGGDFKSTVYGDSVQYTFLGKDDDFTQAVTELRFMATGYMSDRDRVVNLVADPESTLEAGTDYILPNPIVLPANSLELTLPVTFIRSEKLKNDLYWVRFVIEDSDDLKKGYYDLLSFKYIITEKAVKPTNWPTQYYGDYSAAKLRFMFSVLGTEIEWNAYPPTHMANSAKLRQELAKYERDNGPLYGLAEEDEQNIRVTFPG